MISSILRPPAEGVAPGAARFEEKRSIADGDESKAGVGERRKLVFLPGHDAGGFARTPGRAGDAPQGLLVARISEGARDSQGLREIVRSDEEDVECALPPDGLEL